MASLALVKKQEKAKRAFRTGQRAAAQDTKGVLVRRNQSGSGPRPRMLLEVALTPKQVAQARRSALALRDLVVAERSKTVNVERRMLVQILDVLKKAQAHEALRATREATVVLQPKNDEVSPQEAAGILRMSRPSVMRLVEQGHLKSRKVHSHHRLSTAEVVAYARRNARQRTAALDDLSALSQELDI
jgi:excisionase family DNA binding protein